jgi:hypothetical protein
MVTYARVYNHARSLIYHDNIVVLVDDIQWNVLGYNLLLTARIWHHDRYLVERLNLITRLLGLTIYQDITTIGSCLYAITRGILKTYGKELIKTHLRLSLIYGHGEMLIHLVTLAITLWVLDIYII